MWTQLILFILTVLVILADVRKPSLYPPGPLWIPVLGCWPYVAYLVRKLGFAHAAWEHLSRRYGPLVGLRMGSAKVVVVSGAEAVSLVLTDRRFDARPDNFFCRIRTFGKRLGLVFSDGKHWQCHRRFCLRHLRDVGGLGSRRVEALLQREANALVDHIRSIVSSGNGKTGAVIEFNSLFDLPALNVVWSLLAGGRIPLANSEEHDGRSGKTNEDTKDIVHDPQYLLNLVRESFRLQDISGGLLGHMPWLRHVVPSLSGYTQLRSAIEEIWRFLRATVAEHEARLIPGSCPEDLIEAYLLEMKSGAADPTFSEEQLLSVCMDLFMAGSETTANTLCFAFLLLLKNPEACGRATDELDRVVGKDRTPSLSDRGSCPYTEAVIMEVLRRISVAPVAVPHRAIVDVSIMGYMIPKDTTMLIDLRSVHMEKDYWGDPKNFRPERFIDAEGRLKSDPGNLLPFGTGRRRCMAESLARASLFMFISSLLLNFKIRPCPGEDLPDCLEGRDGVTLTPLPFRGFVTPR